MSVLPSEVASLIIPLEQHNLLVPNAAVAEIVPYATAEKEQGAPEWLAGIMQWRDLPLPCLSFEKLIGAIDGEPKADNRIAIFNTLSETYEKRFYGLALTGIPRLVRVIEQEIVEEDAENTSAFESLHVKVNGEACIVPDLLAIEKLLSSAALS